MKKLFTMNIYKNLETLLVDVYRYYNLERIGILINYQNDDLLQPVLKNDNLKSYPASIIGNNRFCIIREGFGKLWLMLKYLFYSLFLEIKRYLLLFYRTILIYIYLVFKKLKFKADGTTIKYDIPTEFSKKPIIFASVCESEKNPGNEKYNGGINELNCLIKLVRRHGYEGYIVTHDGTYEDWLFEHQPCVSIGEFEKIISNNLNIRCVTSWAISHEFLKRCQRIYFWDMELTYTDHCHFSDIARLYRKKIVNSAGISRTIQTWHMATFRKKCYLIPNLLDDDYWKPDSSERRLEKICYMNEGPHTDYLIDFFKKETEKAGLSLEFVQLKGPTKEVLAELQSCNIFISLNIGKDQLWGEGCPRTIIEAMSAGAIVIGYDIIGNREIIINNFNGFIFPQYQHNEVIKKIIYLLKNPNEAELTRINSLNLINSCHKLEMRWPTIKEFLNL